MTQPTPITAKQLEDFSAHYRADPVRKLATTALSKSEMSDVAYVSAGAAQMRHKFSIEIPTLAVTNQKKSGRCWLFASLNLLREKIAKEKNLADFELSQSYAAFWDKFERANFFLESIIETAALPTDDRVVAHILETGVHDGGQWDMFKNLVAKYGIVPKDAMPETAQSENTSMMNRMLNQALKAAAVHIREMAASGAGAEKIDAYKVSVLDRIYGYLCSCYSEPPRSFTFEYVDKDGKYHIERDHTPQSFYEAYIGSALKDTVSIINAPTDDKPYYRTYTVSMLGNVVGGEKVCYLNLPIDEFKALIIRQLQKGELVWFGSDVGKGGCRKEGIWDTGAFDYEHLTGLDLAISKKNGLDYRFSSMGHAMVLTGVNLDENGAPTRWKIENSWGSEKGDKGYYVCSDAWFDLYVYQAVIDRAALGDKAELLDQEPIVLKPWDPMGSLAL